MDNLGVQVDLCKGDNQKISELVEKYNPFICNIVFKKIGNSDDDMLQVARIAFCEAVEQYSPAKGSFIHYAEIVIRNRLNDELRKRYRKQSEIPMDEVMENDIIFNESIKTYNEDNDRKNYKHEIVEYLEELKSWGLCLDKLYRYCPKHKDTRDICKFAAGFLYHNKELKQLILKNNHLPVKKLAKASMLKYRFIEKHSKYIIMIFIVLNGDYGIIKDYIGGISYERE